MKRLLVILLMLLVIPLAVGAGLLVAVQLQPERFAPLVEQLASNAIGRDVTIGSLETVQLGEFLTVEASGLALANPPWAAEAHMAEIAHAAVTLHLPTLWREGPIVVRSIEATGLQLGLQIQEDGESNWQFTTLTGSERTTEPDSGAPFPVVIEYADIRDAALTHRTSTRAVEGKLEELLLAVREEDRFSDLKLRGQLNQSPLTISGAIGPAQALQTGQDMALDLDIALGQLKLLANGQVADLALLTGVDLDLTVNAPRSRFLLDLLGLEEVRDGPLDFSGSIKDGQPGLLVDARGGVADFDLDISGRISDPVAGDGIDLQFALDGPSMAEAGTIFGIRGFRDQPYALSGQVQRNGSLLAINDGELLAGDGRLTLSGKLPAFPDIDDWQADIRGYNLDLAVLGALLGTDALPLNRFNLEGQLAASPEGVELLDMQLLGPELALTLNGVVGELPDLRDSDLKARFAGNDLSVLQPLFLLEEIPAEPFEATAHLTAFDTGWQLQQGRVNSGQFQLELSGHADKLMEFTNLEAQATFSTPNLPAALAAYGVETGSIKDAPLSVSGQARLVAGGYAISQLRGSLAELSFNGEGLISNAPQLAGSRLALKANGTDLQQVLHSVATLDAPRQPFGLRLDATWHAPLVTINHLDLSLGNHHLGANLDLEEGDDGKAMATGSVQMRGSSLGDLFSMLGFDTPIEEKGYRLQSGLTAHTGGLALKDIQVQAEHSDLEGDITLAFGDTPQLDIDLHSRVLFLPYLMPSEETIAQQEQAPADNNSSARLLTPPTREQLKDRIIPATPLPLGWVNHVNGNLRFAIDSIRARDEAEANIEIDLSIKDGVLATRQLAWRGTASDGEAAVTIDARDNANRIELSLDSNRIPLLWMVGTAGQPLHDALYRARLTGEGQTLRDLAASLNGALVFQGAGVKINNRGLDIVLGDAITSVLDRINPNLEAETYTQVECHAGAVTVTNGLVQLNPGTAVRTDRVDSGAFGAIDLKDESLAVSFKTRPRKGLGISAAKAVTPYMMLAGNLAHPHMTVDPEGVVVTGGAAIATMGLSLVAETVWSRYKAATENPCRHILQRAADEPSGVYRELTRDLADGASL